jgi:adenylate cyclase
MLKMDRIPLALADEAAKQRRLAAIMFTDLAGYTALTQRNEALAMQLLEEHRRHVRPFFPKHNGREIKTIGDAFLVEFASALEATRCAFDIQQTLNELNSGRPQDRSIMLRIGIHLGDVIHDQNDVYGDAVNIASRIEPLAPPGGICVSEQVYIQIKNKFEFPLSTLGERNLKNVTEPVEVYKVILPWEEKSASQSSLEKTRIAVLPFTNMSPDPADGYFADGMTEELITSLSGVRQLTVIARTSVMKYKGSQKSASDVGRELNAGSLIEGSVRKAGNRVRITAQLIDAITEGHLWAQNYDRQLEDVFAIQSEIAEKVAAELKIRLVDSEKRVITKKATENTEAYTYYLRGRELTREKTETSLRQAKGLFEKALELDPSFAKAHSGVAECFLHLANELYESYEQSIPKAELSLKKALHLDPELAEAHAALALIDFLEDNICGSETEARHAIELNPSIPEAHYILSNAALVKGDRDEGINAAETAYHLDPVGPRYVERLGSFYFYIGKESEALEFWEKTAELAPAGTYRNKTEYHMFKGNFEKAKEFFSMAEKLEPSNSWAPWMRGFIAARTGDRQTALDAIRKIEENWSGALDLNGIGFIHYGLDDLDSYFTYLNRATDQHLLQYVYPMYCPLFAQGRADPRYEELMEKLRKQMNLTK